jgi:hypothetical protein
MEKKNVTNHKVFLKKSAGYRNMSERMLQIERAFLSELSKKSTVELSDQMEGLQISLSIASYYIVQNEIYHTIFSTSNETILKSARKYMAISIDYLTKTYSTAYEFLYDEKDIRAKAHAEIDEFQGYKMITRVGFYLEYLDQFFDVQSRWHWNILDLSYDLSLVYKNAFNFKTLVQQLDIRADKVYERKAYVQQLKNYLSDTADGLRMKYEITRLNPDMEKAVRVIEVLKQLHVALNEPREVEAQTRKIELWRAKVITDQRS